MTPPTRRDVLLALSAAAAAQAADPPQVEFRAVERNDRSAESYLRSQITNPSDPYRGSVPDQFLLHTAGSASGLIECLSASFVCPQSKLHHNGELLQRIQLAAGFLERSQSSEGNVDLLATNFNSPPDTGFVCHNVATGAAVARLYHAEEIVRALQPFLVRAAAGMSTGGIHTPNHRWVVSSALAQINALFPNPAYTRRIGQWLAEGIDIDEDGQYIERSTVTYNTITDRAFVVLAEKLKRPELLDPVRRNLNAMLYLMHPDGEVVTEVSRRQDQFVRAGMAGYWFPLQLLALRDQNGQFATLGGSLAPDHATLPALLEYPELSGKLPATQPLPENYERLYPAVGLARIRRGQRDATIVLQGNSRFFSMRNGDAVVSAVRFATSFFGKGQFIPTASTKYALQQSLQAPYYQPLDPPQRVTYRNWEDLRSKRKQTQVCRLTQSATITETKTGFTLHIESKGTNGVPLAIEINLREGAQIEGARAVPNQPDAWLLDRDFANIRAGRDRIRIGPGAAPHLNIQLRGAEPKLAGPSLYITGYTPFDHTIAFDCV